MERIRYLTVCTLLLALSATCLSVIEVLIDGSPSTRTQFCIGERLTFVCTDEVDVYLWTIPPLVTGNNLQVQSSPGLDVDIEGVFTARYIARGNSTLEVVVFDGLNMANVTCNNLIGQVLLSSYNNIQLHGSVPAPSITSANATVDSFSVTIQPSTTNTVCITEYRVSAVSACGSDGQYEYIISVQDGSAIVTKTLNNPNPCNVKYTFRARVSINMEYSDNITASVNFNGIGDVNITKQDNEVTWLPPQRLSNCTNCTLSYNVSLQNSGTSMITTSLTLSDTGLTISSPCYYDNVMITPVLQEVTLYDSSATIAVSNGSVRTLSMIMDGNILIVTIEVLVGDCPDYFVETLVNGNLHKNYTTATTRVTFPVDSMADCIVRIVSSKFGILAMTDFPCVINTDSTTTELSPSLSSPSSPAAIVGGVVGGIVAVVLILILVVGGLLCCKYCKSSKEPGNVESLPSKNDNKTGVSYDDAKYGGSKDTPHDVLPMYQDPAEIQRQAAGPSGDVYTVPERKAKKGSVKNGQSEELPMYTVVDKSNQRKEDGLVYADLEVQNRSSRSKRPPPPPGVTQHDAMEPVLYSTVH